jgi:hypothetical protein
MVVGATFSGVSSTALLTTGQVSSSGAFLIFSLGTIGSLLPDIDSKSSIPFKVTFTLLSVFTAFAMIFSKAGYSLVELFLLWLGTYFFMKYIVMELFIRLTIHRGIFHTIPMGILAGIISSIALNNLFFVDSKLAVWGGFFIAFGFIIHLALDEIYSVDLFNKRLKSYFGTAFTLYKRDNLVGTFAIYLLIAMLLPNIEISDLFNILSSETFYTKLWQTFLPNGTLFHGFIKF